MLLVIKKVKKSILQHKKIFLILSLLLFLLSLSFLIYSFFFANKKRLKKQAGVYLQQTEEIDLQAYPLPQRSEEAFFQQDLADLNGDGIKEAIVLSSQPRDSHDNYDVYFLIFQFTDNQWQKRIEQGLEGFSVHVYTSEAESLRQSLNRFELISLRNRPYNDVFVQTRAQGSGEFSGFFVFGWDDQEKNFSQLMVLGPIPHGSGGVEDNKVWAISPNYGPDDPNCCPSTWSKNWYQWQNNEFSKIGDYTGSNLDEVQKQKYSHQFKEEMGFIEGSLGYPSEGIPSDMLICAQNLETQKLYCTNAHLQDPKYTYGLGYKLEVASGKYHVYSTSPSFGEFGYQAFFTEFVTCGMSTRCRSHKPVTVAVLPNKTTDQVDPIDWYAD